MANIKALRMDARRIEDEEHDYGKGALVISGHLRLQVAGEEVVVGAGYQGPRLRPLARSRRISLMGHLTFHGTFHVYRPKTAQIRSEKR
ncbi:hypothetical protein [Serratia nevei]|uniref:hypothetical protein n=1 Tax=Serratia nevei TaxID=2703794 RepID=UPI0038641CF4